MRNLSVILIICCFNCSQKNDFITKSIVKGILRWKTRQLVLIKESNKAQVPDTINNPNWQRELGPLMQINYEDIRGQKGMHIDTIENKITKTTILMHSCLSCKAGWQKFYIVLDSGNNCIQFSGIKSEGEGKRQEKIAYFWDTKGDYQIIKDKTNENNEAYIIGNAVEKPSSN